MALIVISRADGVLTILNVSEVAGAEPLNQAGAQVHVDRWLENDEPGWLPITWELLLPGTILPSSKRWRLAWTLAGGVVTVPLARARFVRAVELGRIREERLAKLTQLIDTAVDNAQAALAAALRVKRRNLRDVDLAAAVQAINDIGQLDQFEPIELDVLPASPATLD